MQSWQADLLNLQLTLTFKQMLKYVGSVDRIRTIMDFADTKIGPILVPGSTIRTPVSIPGAQFEAEWVSAWEHDPERFILYLPGGAYIIRMPNCHTGMVSRLCRCANARALMVYYRLAPEYSFPACLDDAVLAYQWMLDQGIPADKIAVAGDSAGGGLTLSTLLAIRDRGLPPPGCGLMLSPVLDFSDTAPSRFKNALSDSALPAPARRGINPRQLILGELDPGDPMISPLNGDLTGLPPLYLQVSDSEMLLDDGLRLARRGHTYDVEVQVDLWHKVPHVWQLFPFLPEAAQALEKCGRFLQQHTIGLDPATLDQMAG